MYETHFGLQTKPFGMTPDPAFLYLSSKHREALAGLVYAVMDRMGFLVLTGDAGTGKTTLLAQALRGLPLSRVQSSVVLNPTLSTSEFLEMVMMDFGIDNIPSSKARRLAALQTFLIQVNHSGKIAALIVDEAHKLSPEVLEEIRLLGNIELPNQKLIQILLVGQNELADLLNRTDLRQLKQRIAVRFAINPLSGADIGNYIQHRWTKGGASQPPPFDAEAVQAIARWSGGIPRVINAICENALLAAFGENASQITIRQVTEACVDLDLTRQTLPVAAGIMRELVTAGNGTPKMKPDVSSPVPATAELPVVPQLERFGDAVVPSLWSRWAGKLGLQGNGGSV